MLKIEKLNLTQKVAYNIAFSSLGKFLEIIIALFVIKIITGYLGLDGYGDYGTVIAFTYIFSVLADFGLYSVVVKEISENDDEEEKIIRNAFTIRFFLGGLVIFTSYLFSFLFPYSNEIRFGVLIVSFGYWVFNANQVLMGLFQKHLAMDKVSIYEVLGRFVQFIGILICARYDLGFYGVLSFFFVGGFVNLLLVFIYAKKFVRLGFSFDFPFWKVLLKKSFPLAISAVLVLIYFKLDTIMLSVIKGSRDVGIYTLSYKVMETFIFFPAMIVGLTMPMMSRFAFSDVDKFKSVAQRTLNFLLIAIVPLVFGMSFISEKIIFLLSKPEFIDSAPVLRVLSVALIFIFLGSLFSNMIIAFNNQKYLAYIYFIGAVFNVAANFIFIPKFSYMGAASTTLATEFLVTLLMIYVFYKNTKIVLSFKTFFKALFSSVVMVAVLQNFNYLNIVYLIFIGAFVYAIILYIIGGISKEEISKLLQKRM